MRGVQCSKQPVCAKKAEEIAKVKELIRESEGSAGARSIAEMATAQDVSLSRYRAGRLMEMPTYGYRSFLQAQHHTVKYLIGYYSQLRPQQHNVGMSPNMAEQKHWINYKPVASFS